MEGTAFDHHCHCEAAGRGNLLVEYPDHRDLKVSTASSCPPAFMRGMSKRSAGQGGVCGTVLLLLPRLGEFALRQDSPRPSGTPLINAGGKGAVPILGAFVVGFAYREIPTASE